MSAICALLIGSPAVGPSIRFEELTHDFGTIPSDTKQSLSWTFRNVGSSPLQIVATQTSCGCTAGSAEPASVPPGTAGVLSVTFDPAGQSGDVRKTLTVVSNDPEHPRTVLTILAKVIEHRVGAVAAGHPRDTGQSLLMGSCARCHASPAAGRSGEALWGAICAMCHGATGNGASAPGVRAKAFLAGCDDSALTHVITYGTANPKMPGFSELMGGPLDAEQIASLVTLLRRWGPNSADEPAAPAGSSR